MIERRDVILHRIRTRNEYLRIHHHLIACSPCDKILCHRQISLRNHSEYVLSICFDYYHGIYVAATIETICGFAYVFEKPVYRYIGIRNNGFFIDLLMVYRVRYRVALCNRSNECLHIGVRNG